MPSGCGYNRLQEMEKGVYKAWADPKARLIDRTELARRQLEAAKTRTCKGGGHAAGHGPSTGCFLPDLGRGAGDPRGDSGFSSFDEKWPTTTPWGWP